MNSINYKSKDVDPFLFNWEGNFKSARTIEMSLHGIFEDVTVINSDDSNRLFHWKNIGEKSFFTAQWFKCLDLHKSNKILFHVQADTQYDHWDQLVVDALHYMKKYKAGIYYPRVTNVEWSEDHTTEIKGLPTSDLNIKYIANGDETVWFIHPKIIDYFKAQDLQKYFAGNRIGWGWDVIFCGISYILGMPVIRDSNHVIDHAKSRGYNNSEAQSQFDDLINQLPFELRWYAHNSRIDKRRVFLKKYIKKHCLP